jgi:hypothetical protein
MEDEKLAIEIATHRAIALAVLLNEAKIYYTSDYFEKKSEEYRWLVMQENVQEMGKLTGKAFVDTSCYKVLKSEINENGEALVLINYTPSMSQDTNFFVYGEFYRQDFEVSNTRAQESIRSIKLDTKWKQKTLQDTLTSSFQMTNFNGSVSSLMTYNKMEIQVPGYFYQYESTLKEGFVLKDFNTSVNLIKGLWISQIDSFFQSLLKLSKNYSVKIGTVHDDYKVNRDDGISETSTENLARTVCANLLSFEFGGFSISDNCLFPRIFLHNERTPFQVNCNSINQPIDTVKVDVKKVCWLKRVFRKKVVSDE